MVISYTINKGASLITNEYRRLAGILIELSDRPVLYWASVCGFHPSNVSNWLRGRETLSEENQARLLKALYLDLDTMKLDPSRVHIWIVAVHEPETLKDAAEAFLESETWMTMLSPDPDGPDALSQAPQVALLRSGNLRIVLLRKLFPTKMSENPLSQKAGTPWIRPSLIPGGRWKAKGIASDEDAPPLLAPGPLLFDLVLGNVSIDQFDALMEKSAPWNWKDVEALARKMGLSAREVAEMIRDRRSR